VWVWPGRFLLQPSPFGDPGAIPIAAPLYMFAGKPYSLPDRRFQPSLSELLPNENEGTLKTNGPAGVRTITPRAYGAHLL
jgi:hypothetical protein